MNILEIGSCSMLDHDYKSRWPDINWTKIVHVTKPLFYDELLTDDEFESLEDTEFRKFDVVILSRSVRDKSVYGMDSSYAFRQNLRDCNSINIIDFTNKLDRIIRTRPYRTRFVLLSSTCVEIPYKARPIYAATKAYQSNFFKNMSLISEDNSFIEYRLPSVKTRMCDHGVSSIEIFDRVINDIRTIPFYSDKNYLIMNI